jgi:dolichol-phosphate mannosyltransferase
MARPELTLVIPIYNEEEALPSLEPQLHDLVTQVGGSSEVVFVDDGSTDRSLELLRAMAGREPRYRVVSFSRNFGHQRAITAGMDLARGKAVVIMDADLQDPPEVVVEMMAKFREGYDVVYGRRRKRVGETWFKLTTAKVFYRLFAAMIPIEVPLDTGDFRLMSRRVVLTLRGLRESHRFVRGLVAWAGFRQTAVEYDRAARVAGETKYPLRKMVSFALDGIASFSTLPLRAATYIGVIVGLASVLYGFVAILTAIVGFTVPGWTTTVVLVSFLFSVQLIVTGVLGDYVGRIYEQVKRRPLYVVGEKINFGKKKKRSVVEESAPEVTDSHFLPPENVPTLIGHAPAPPPQAFPPPVPSSKAAPSIPPEVPKAARLPTTRSGAPPPVTAKPSKPPPPMPSKSAAPPPVAPKPSTPPPPPAAAPKSGSPAKSSVPPAPAAPKIPSNPPPPVAPAPAEEKKTAIGISPADLDKPAAAPPPPPVEEKKTDAGLGEAPKPAEPADPEKT